MLSAWSDGLSTLYLKTWAGVQISLSLSLSCNRFNIIGNTSENGRVYEKQRTSWKTLAIWWSFFLLYIFTLTYKLETCEILCRPTLSIQHRSLITLSSCSNQLSENMSNHIQNFDYNQGGCCQHLSVQKMPLNECQMSTYQYLVI